MPMFIVKVLSLSSLAFAHELQNTLTDILMQTLLVMIISVQDKILRQ